MQTTDIIKWIIVIAGLVVVAVIIVSSRDVPLPVPKAPRIRDIASRDLSHIGVYSDKLTISVKYWVLAIIIRLYNHDKDIDFMKILQEWNKSNYDPKSYIMGGIDAAYTDFLNTLEDARLNNKDPEFKVSDEYDYHELPGTFRNNEFISPWLLIDEVDHILGGE